MGIRRSGDLLIAEGWKQPFFMKKFNPIKKVIPNLREKVIPKIREEQQSILSAQWKTIEKTEKASNFLTELQIFSYLYHVLQKRLSPVILNSGNFSPVFSNW